MANPRPTPQQRVQARIDELPVFPAVAVRVLGVLKQADHDVCDVARCVELDPALAVRVLALANSALFSPKRPIRTIAHATLYIGERALFGAVLAAAAERFFHAKPLPTTANEATLWEHSLAVSSIARKLAQRVGLDGDRAMALGILHDVGLLYLRTETQALQEEIEAARSAGLSRREAELATFGADHALLGGALLAAFGLPEDLANGVTTHHDVVEDAPASEEDCVHLADKIAAAAGLLPDEEVPPEEPSPLLLSRLAVDVITLEELVKEAPADLAAMQQQLGVA